MAFRRGFKSQCERRAVEIRKDLGLTSICPLNSFDLADHLKITVWSTEDVKELTDEEHFHLEKGDDDCWSALTLRFDTSHLVVYKAGQSVSRVNSVVMHELSHIILGHELSEACVLEDGSLVPSNYSPDQEDEADWLAGTLLLPRPALLKIVKERMPKPKAREKYGVSRDMLTYRTRMTGVEFQVKSSRGLP